MRNLHIITICAAAIIFAVLPAHAADPDSMQVAAQIVALQVGQDAKIKAGDTLTAMVSPMVERDNPGQEQQIAAIAEKTIKPAMVTGADNIARQTAELYAQYFTKDELDQMLAFQTSPVGQKFRKFNTDDSAKLRDMAKNESNTKAQDAVHQFVTQLRAASLRVPKELEH